MNTFSNSNILIASLDDVVEITALLNVAYRGEGSKQGWTTEADLIAGEVRTNEAKVHEVIQQQLSVLLKYVNEKQQIVGCVNLQQHHNKLYLGMFSVLPNMQGSGIGKQLLLAAEEYAHSVQCIAIYMTVIDVRTELIQWYQRYGYKDTGERKPFIEDELSGKHLQPLTFMTLEKNLRNS